MTMTCRRCGHREAVLRWHTCQDRRRHVEARCASCHRPVMFVSQTPEVLAEVGDYVPPATLFGTAGEEDVT